MAADPQRNGGVEGTYFLSLDLSFSSFAVAEGPRLDDYTDEWDQ